MRRKEKEITNYDEITDLLNRAAVCRIALAADNCPYIVPVNFVMFHKDLYFHSSPDGRKMEILRSNNAVCFEVDLDVQIVRNHEACSWGAKYRSVIGFGQAFFVNDADEKIKILNCLMAKYAGEGPYHYKEEVFKKVAVIGIRTEQITGKKSGYK